MNFARKIKFNLLHLVRNKGNFFWNTFFPIIIASFFIIVFSNFKADFKPVNVSTNRDGVYYQVLKDIKFLNIVEHGDNITKDLIDKKYSAYINDDLSIEVTESNTNITLVKNVLNQVKQISETNIDRGEIIKNLNSNFIEYKNQNIGLYEGIIFSVIIMTSLYTIFGGVVYVDSIRFENSEIAKRLLVSPIKKSKYLFENFLVEIVVELFNLSLLLLFLKIVFNVSIIKNYFISFLIVLTTMILGLTLGMFISTFSKLEEKGKTQISLGVILFMVYTSGMLGPENTNLILENIPFLALVNPACYLQKSFISINILNQTSDLFMELIYPNILSILLFIASILKLRRTKHNDF